MGRCPNCGDYIDHLWYKEIKFSWYRFTIINGETRYEYDDDEDSESDGFYCPNCWERICEDEEEALEILEGESNSPRGWEI